MNKLRMIEMASRLAIKTFLKKLKDFDQTPKEDVVTFDRATYDAFIQECTKK